MIVAGDTEAGQIAGVHHVRIIRAHGDIAAFAAAHVMPLQLRGLGLTNVVEVRQTNAPTADMRRVRVISTGKAEVPKDADVQRVGDSAIELEWTPASAATATKPGAFLTTNWVVAVGPMGTSEPWPVWVVARGRLVREQEPNGGFRQAQKIAVGQILAGGIKESADVDVFQFDCRPGQQLVAEVRARSGGSLLDAVLTVHDERGRVVASNDDADGGTDSRLRWTADRSGPAYLVVQDAHDRGGLAHPYLLSLDEWP